jgi:hypothetical protein
MELLGAAAVGYVAHRFLAPRLAEVAKKKPDSIWARYGAAPYLLAGGYAAQRLGSGLVRTIGDTAMVSGALLFGARSAPQTADSSFLLSLPEKSGVSGDDDIGADASLTPAEMRALQAAAMISGDDIGDDDIDGDVAAYLNAVNGDDIGADDGDDIGADDGDDIGADDGDDIGADDGDDIGADDGGDIY